jgi:hypothetical protein
MSEKSNNISSENYLAIIVVFEKSKDISKCVRNSVKEKDTFKKQFYIMERSSLSGLFVVLNAKMSINGPCDLESVCSCHNVLHIFKYIYIHT